MSKSCAMIPKIVNPTTKEVQDSKLFKDLLSFTSNRKEAVDTYLKIQNKDFLNKIKKQITFDELNEPKFWDLIRFTDLKKTIGSDILNKKLSQKVGFSKNNTPILHESTESNYSMLMQKAIEYNSNNDAANFYLATIGTFLDDKNISKLGIYLQEYSDTTYKQAVDMQQQYLLNEKLKKILKDANVEVGSLTALEQKLKITGITDFNTAKEAAKGLINLIRLDASKEGQQALPEEFAHFLIEANLDNNLIQRVLNLLETNPELINIYLKDQTEEYQKLYNNDSLKLRKEVLAKIIAKHLFNQQEVPIKYKSLFTRLIEYLKTFLRNLTSNVSDIQKAINDVESISSILSANTLSGELAPNLNNIHKSEKFYQVSNSINSNKELLTKIIEREVKRLHIYSQRAPDSKFTETQQQLITTLQANIIEHTEIEGIYSFLEHATNQLEALSKRLKVLNETQEVNYNDKARVLRDIRNYLSSYTGIIEDIRMSIKEDSKEENKYKSNALDLSTKLLSLITDLSSAYKQSSFPLFADFLKLYVGDSISVPLGNNKDKTYTINQLLTMAETDIGFFDRWLDSMADSSEPILKIFDHVVKISKNKARLRTIELSKEIKKLGLTLEQAGVKDFTWMFEKDINGNLSGNYIGEINSSIFEHNRKEMLDRLKSKYGKSFTKESIAAYKKERKDWYNANTIVIDGIRKPKFEIYENKEFTNLSKEKREFYDKIIALKESLDSLLPAEYTTTLNAIKIRKDLVERIKNSTNLKEATVQFTESIKDAFIRRSDDIDFGDRTTIKDFEDREVQTLPIYYTKWKDKETLNDLSTDIISTMVAYANMAIEFDEMNKVLHILEVGRDIIREREVGTLKGGKPVKERIKEAGYLVESKLTKKGIESNIVARINDFFEMQVYGRYIKDEGTIKRTNIDKAKIADNINMLTSINNLALNLLSGISNIATGKIMMRIESLAGEFFNQKNVINADKIYTQALPAYLAQIGSRARTDKLALWEEYFDVLQDHDKSISNIDFSRKSIFSKLFKTESLFFLNRAGEHWMQLRTSLALADAYKLKDKNGKEINLWEALDVIPIDKTNLSLGSKLIIKDGVTKLDGSTLTEEDLIKFSRKSMAINERMHGIYNKADKAAFQKLAIGRMAFMFRKWIKPALNRRFKSASYNYDLEAWTEGYYLTSYNFLTNLIKDIKTNQFNIGARWNELTTTEKANLRRSMIEVSHFLALLLLISILDWEDDKSRPWVMKMTEYQLRRLYTEIGALIPGPTMVTEGFKILKSPAAGINTLEDLGNLAKLLVPPYYFDEIQSGRYKGHSTAYKAIFESPLIPMNKTVYKVLNPEVGIPFFK